MTPACLMFPWSQPAAVRHTKFDTTYARLMRATLNIERPTTAPVHNGCTAGAARHSIHHFSPPKMNMLWPQISVAGGNREQYLSPPSAAS